MRSGVWWLTGDQVGVYLGGVFVEFCRQPQP